LSMSVTSTKELIRSLGRLRNPCRRPSQKPGTSGSGNFAVADASGAARASNGARKIIRTRSAEARGIGKSARTMPFGRPPECSVPAQERNRESVGPINITRNCTKVVQRAASSAEEPQSVCSCAPHGTGVERDLGSAVGAERRDHAWRGALQVRRSLQHRQQCLGQPGKV